MADNRERNRMGSPFSETDTVSVTFKHNGKYEDPWIVFHANPMNMKGYLIEHFKLGSPETFEDYSLAQVVHEANTQSVAEYNIKHQLGGTVVTKGVRTKANAPTVASGSDSDGSAATAPAEEVTLLDVIKAQTNVKDLRLLYSSHPEIGTTPELKGAWNTRGKELSAK